MSFFSKNFIKNISRLSEVPKLKPKDILVMPESNRIIDSDIFPYTNYNNRAEWVSSHRGEGSIRLCPGTTDLMQMGITIPLWADLRVRPGMNGQLEAEFNIVTTDERQAAGKIEPFTYEQTGKCPYTDKRDPLVEKAQYLKLVSPYQIRTPKGYSTLIIGHTMYPSKDFDVIPGVVNTDYYHTVNVVLNILSDQQIFIPRKYPIAQLIVFKRSDNIKNMIIGDESTYQMHKEKGFLGPWIPSFSRKGRYKKEQREWDR